jgi:ABC-type multidrug transport system permease subunit
MHQMAGAMFRLLGAILKTMVVANTFGMFVLLFFFLFGGFVIPRSKYDTGNSTLFQNISSLVSYYLLDTK